MRLSRKSPAVRNPDLAGEGWLGEAPGAVHGLSGLATLEAALGRKAQLELLPMQPGDVAETYADVADLARDVGFKPATPIEPYLDMLGE